jgi:hypothetical protein
MIEFVKAQDIARIIYKRNGRALLAIYDVHVVCLWVLASPHNFSKIGVSPGICPERPGKDRQTAFECVYILILSPAAQVWTNNHLGEVNK